MIRRCDKRNYRSVGVILDTEPEESNSFCSTCQAVGKLSRLKQKISLDSAGKLLPPGPDADQYLMCWNCGLTIPTRDAKLSGKISPINGVSPVENPFDIKKTVLGVDSKHRYQRLQKRKNRHEDKEVQAELDRGNLVTDYQTSMPT